MNLKLVSYLICFSLSIFIYQNALAGGVKGKVKLEGVKDDSGVLIYIGHVDGKFPPPQNHALMDQKDLKFIPKVLPVLAGTKVNFLNSDNVLHNVFTPTRCAGQFNLGTWPKGKIRSHTFNKANCFVTILCDVHPEMQAWIAVLQNPYFIQTNEKGEFEIKNLPPGNYQLKVWYPFFESKSINIMIKDNHILEENFSLKRTGE